MSWSHGCPTITEDAIDDEPRNCTRCGEMLPAEAFYFVTRKTGKRRGMCKECMREVKAAQRDPNWLPTCSRCGKERSRSGPGRRLCVECFNVIYDAEAERGNGSHRLKLNPCTACGVKRLRADHVKGTSLCPTCRSVPQGRRTKLNVHFNLNPREYLALLDKQRDVCAICGRKPRGASLHVDHRHEAPSIIRGLTCNSCNTILGLARDDPARLRAAAEYLENPPAQMLFPGRTATEKGNRRGGYRQLRRVA